MISGPIPWRCGGRAPQVQNVGLLPCQQERSQFLDESGLEEVPRSAGSSPGVASQTQTWCPAWPLPPAPLRHHVRRDASRFRRVSIWFHGFPDLPRLSPPDWRSDKYNKWELNEGKSALQDLDSLADIFADLPHDNVTITADHPTMGPTVYSNQGKRAPFLFWFDMFFFFPRCASCFVCRSPGGGAVQCLSTRHGRVAFGGGRRRDARRLRGLPPVCRPIPAGTALSPQASDVVELPRREGAPLRVRPVTALRHPCFRRDGPPPARFCVTFDYVGLFFFTLPYPSGVHYPLTRDLRTKVFSCIPCEAHGQTVKKNWYRSRQRAPWMDSEGRVRRGYTQVLEFDNLYMNLVMRQRDLKN